MNAGNRWLIAAIAALTIIAVVRVASTHRVFSETLDEPVHVVAGYEWLTSRYRTDLHSPPLGRILSALPLRLAGVPPPPPGSDVERGNFLFYYGDRYEKTLARARIGTLVWLLVCVVTLAFWAWRTFSPAVAVIAVALFTNLPPILGHAGLATVDISLTAAMTLALFSVDRYLQKPTAGRAALLGLTVGMGVLTKFTFIVFFPPSALVLAVFRWKRDSLSLRPILLAAAMAALVIWGGYQFEVARPVDVSESAALLLERAVPEPLRPAARWLVTKLPIPAPGLLVGMALVHDHDRSGHLAYLNGRLSLRGWWYYFPAVFFYKTPIPFMILAACGIILAVVTRKGIEHALIPVVIVLLVMPASLNIGLRYILPVYVSLSLLAAYAVVEIWRRARDVFGRSALAALLGWFFIGVAVDHPDYLAWFNEAAGPVPSRIAVDSNLDWGQDVLRLARVVKARNIDALWILYSTNAKVERHGIPARPLIPGRPVSGWLAIGETPLRLSALDGGLEWLSVYRPVARVGKSIRLYHIPDRRRQTLHRE